MGIISGLIESLFGPTREMLNAVNIGEEIGEECARQGARSVSAATIERIAREQGVDMDDYGLYEDVMKGFESEFGDEPGDTDDSGSFVDWLFK